MERPFVVCHMLASLDGKIDGAFFSMPETAPALKEYAALRKIYHCQATLYGTTTMLGGYADGPAPALPADEQRAPGGDAEDYVDEAGRAMENFIVSVDPAGALGFRSNCIARKGRPAAHVIELLTRRAAPAYADYLRRLGISYLFVGENRLDCGLALRKLQQRFSIERLMIAGGGMVNWSFLQEALIDELSLVIAPVADGSTCAVSIFERADFLPPHAPVPFCLQEARRLEGDTLWLRYTRR